MTPFDILSSPVSLWRMLESVPYAIALTIAVIAAWDGGRRWLRALDHSAAYSAKLAALKAEIDQNRTRTDLAITNLAKEAREELTDIKRKQQALIIQRDTMTRRNRTV